MGFDLIAENKCDLSVTWTVGHTVFHSSYNVSMLLYAKAQPTKFAKRKKKKNAVDEYNKKWIGLRGGKKGEQKEQIF